MQEEQFVAQVIANGRVTIPDTIRALLTIKEGDFVELKVRKREAV
jgi:AbrB family looped-hinge helix DNA binding protein